jgi:inner membrane protein
VPTLITHAVVGAALSPLGPRSVSRGRLIFALVLLSMLPDLDVVSFHIGIPYSHWLGHRGLSHSLLFAIFLAALVARFDFRNAPLASLDRWRLFAVCALAMASHGVLDAFTDGGLGIAFFLPFSSQRFFFPFHPLVVSPIGLQNFISGPAIAVLVSEVLYVWVPIFVILVWVRVSRRRHQSTA